MAQHLEPPSGTGRDDPENKQPTTSPRTTRGCQLSTGSILTGQYALVPMTSWAAIDDLIWLFESEPQFAHADLGYPVSATTFTTVRGSTFVECTIEPYMNSLTLRCVEQGEERVLLHLWGVVDTIAVDKSEARETLVVTLLSELPFRALRLDLKPSVRLAWASVAPWAPGLG